MGTFDMKIFYIMYTFARYIEWNQQQVMNASNQASLSLPPQHFLIIKHCLFSFNELFMTFKPLLTIIYSKHIALDSLISNEANRQQVCSFIHSRSIGMHDMQRCLLQRMLRKLSLANANCLEIFN